MRTHEGWQTPDDWESQLRTPNRPVVGVSWFEAMAYCRWLSAEHPTRRMRLPTVAEWIAAASPDGRRYPWGDQPDPDDTRANFGRHVNAPTPVGIYPAGKGKHGHADLAGNVWEWSLDVYKGITAKMLRVYGQPRIFCGGCYWDEAGGMAAAERFRFRSFFRHVHGGFRVVSEPASP
ncbi:MAG: SUMF1/EgtB/PvdO family nonheme iron enzyme [Nannocystis sp.]|nr:SUMF1/EgtB/PvdO family nonheme iron enzyme [Nannocystis sp.]